MTLGNSKLANIFRFPTELPKLEEIHFNGQLHDFETLVEQQVRFNRPNFRIFFRGYEFTAANLPESFHELGYYSPNYASVQFIRQHLSKFVLKNQTYVQSFYFNVFADCFPDGIPEELLERLVNLSNLHVNRTVRDAQELVKVLRIVGRSLRQVEIASSSLEQSIFDLLPEMCPVLGALTIKERAQLNANFILRFKSLKNATIYNELSTEIVKAALERYEHLELLSFFYQEYRIQLNRQSGDGSNRINLVIINEDGHYSAPDRTGGKASKARVRSELITELGLEHLKCKGSLKKH